MKRSPAAWTPAALLILAGSTHALAGPFPASIDLSSLNGTDGFVINGIDSGDFSGFSVSSAGDVNGDGLAVTQCTNIGGAYFSEALCANIVCPGCEADLDNDGDTDVFDFGIFAPDFGGHP